MATLNISAWEQVINTQTEKQLEAEYQRLDQSNKALKKKVDKAWKQGKTELKYREFFHAMNALCMEKYKRLENDYHLLDPAVQFHKDYLPLQNTSMRLHKFLFEFQKQLSLDSSLRKGNWIVKNRIDYLGKVIQLEDRRKIKKLIFDSKNPQQIEKVSALLLNNAGLQTLKESPVLEKIQKTVERIHIADNRLESLPENEILRCTNLEILDVSHNPLSKGMSLEFLTAFAKKKIILYLDAKQFAAHYSLLEKANGANLEAKTRHRAFFRFRIAQFFWRIADFFRWMFGYPTKKDQYTYYSLKQIKAMDPKEVIALNFEYSDCFTWNRFYVPAKAANMGLA